MTVAFWIFAGLWLISVAEISIKWSSKEKEEETEDAVPEADKFAKIGSVDVPFSKVMHTCDVEKLDDEKYSIGDVVMCQHPDCGKEFVLGWQLANNSYYAGYDEKYKSEKMWIPMATYEKDPTKYVYSK